MSQCIHPRPLWLLFLASKSVSLSPLLLSRALQGTVAPATDWSCRLSAGRTGEEERALPLPRHQHVLAPRARLLGEAAQSHPTIQERERMQSSSSSSSTSSSSTGGGGGALMRKLGGRFTAGFAKGKREQPSHNNNSSHYLSESGTEGGMDEGEDGEDEDGYTALATVRPASRVLNSTNAGTATKVQSGSTFPSGSSTSSVAGDASMSIRSRNHSRQLYSATSSHTSRRYDAAQLVSRLQL